MKNNKAIISWGNSTDYGKKLSKKLNMDIIMPKYKKFSNGESYFQFNNALSKLTEVWIYLDLRSSPNDKLCELILILNHLKNFKLKKINLFSPWLSYSPQDKVFLKGEILSSRLVINILEHMGVQRFVLLDTHSDLVISHFNNPVKNILPYKEFSEYFDSSLISEDLDNYRVVILDKGSRFRSQIFARQLNLKTIQLKKRRNRYDGSISFAEKNIKEISGKNVLCMDDYTSTGSTIIKSAELLKASGAKKCLYFISHILTKEALEKILNNSAIDRLITLDLGGQKLEHEKLFFVDIIDSFCEAIQ
jgi:ribose-phosphate pyrophosphokinase